MTSTRLALAGLFAAAILTAAPAVSAPTPPPPPAAVQIINVRLGPKTASFAIQVTPARIDATRVYPTYQFSIAPKFCTFSAPAGPGNFPTQTFAAGGPYLISLQCSCNRAYTAMASTAPPDAYTARSRWINSVKVDMPCTK